MKLNKSIQQDPRLIQSSGELIDPAESYDHVHNHWSAEVTDNSSGLAPQMPRQTVNPWVVDIIQNNH